MRHTSFNSPPEEKKESRWDGTGWQSVLSVEKALDSIPRRKERRRRRRGKGRREGMREGRKKGEKTNQN